MSEFSDSYILRVLLAPHTPTRAVDTVARRWRWLRASVCDSYRPELHYMRNRSSPFHNASLSENHRRSVAPTR